MSTTWYPQGPKIPVTSGSGPYLVRWVDYKGNILKSQFATAGQTLSNPTPPVFPGLTWSGWSGSATNIKCDIDVIGVWTPTDGKTHIFVEASALAGLTPTIKVNKSDTSTLLVEWGDGTTSTSTASGNVAITKDAPYSAGFYEIKKSISVGAGTFSGGYGTTGNPMVDGVSVLEVWLRPTSTAISAYACNGSAFRSLLAITGMSGVLTVGAQAFTTCYELGSIALPVATAIGDTGINATQVRVSIPLARTFAQAFISPSIPACSLNLPAATAIPNYAMDVYNISRILIGPDCVSIGIGAINSRSLISLRIEATSPPALAASTSIYAYDPRLIIYVPSASVAAYQAASNWSAFASRIVGF